MTCVGKLPRLALLAIVVALASVVGYLAARLFSLEKSLDGLAHRLNELEDGSDDERRRDGDEVR